MNCITIAEILCDPYFLDSSAEQNFFIFSSENGKVNLHGNEIYVWSAVKTGTQMQLGKRKLRRRGIKLKRDMRRTHADQGGKRSTHSAWSIYSLSLPGSFRGFSSVGFLYLHSNHFTNHALY